MQTENPACSTGEERAESVAKRKRKEPKNKKSPHFTGMKRPVWEKIAKEMKKQGYNRTADQCKERIRALEKKYKKIKEDMNETGKGNNSDSFPILMHWMRSWALTHLFLQAFSSTLRNLYLLLLLVFEAPDQVLPLRCQSVLTLLIQVVVGLQQLQTHHQKMLPHREKKRADKQARAAVTVRMI